MLAVPGESYEPMDETIERQLLAEVAAGLALRQVDAHDLPPGGEQTIQQSLRAQNQLVEHSLPIASYITRLSLGMHGIARKSKKEAAPWRFQSGTSSIPYDFATLRSERADPEERLQAAHIGLMMATRTFDRTKAITAPAFTTWAAFCAKREITKLVRGDTEYSGGIHIPETMRLQINLAIAEADGTYKPILSDSERAHLLQFAVMQEVDSLEAIVERQPSKLDALGGTIEEWPSEDKTAPDVFPPLPADLPAEVADIVANNQLREGIANLLNCLKHPREQAVIRFRFGIGTDGPLTLAEIGKVFNIGKEQVRRIENKAMNILRYFAYHSRREELSGYESDDELIIQSFGQGAWRRIV